MHLLAECVQREGKNLCGRGDFRPVDCRFRKSPFSPFPAKEASLPSTTTQCNAIWREEKRGKSVRNVTKGWITAEDD